jgi:hypothetical protein
MHRSGTSMVTSMLQQCGLYLGAETELMGATPDNVRGHWEHKQFVGINDEILRRRGATWYAPPDRMPNPNAWDDLPDVRQRAASLVASFAGHEPWGWKDPRSSLTLPFWLDLLPELRVVVCVRNPFEVADSLRKRPVFKYANGNVLWRTYKELRSSISTTKRRFFSEPACLRLWRIYNERILESIEPSRRLLTHYDSYFEDAQAELSRLVRFLGIKTTAGTIRDAAALASRELRHNRVADETAKLKMTPENARLYLDLCEETRCTTD